MDRSWADVIFWTVVITVIAITVIISGFILMEGFNPEYAPNVEVHMCDYKACCEDQTDNYFDCDSDSSGCPNVIPNWTHPDCGGGGP